MASPDKSDMEVDSENIEQEFASEDASTKKQGKRSFKLDKSYLHGLYPGHVPEELKGLNNIEFSVIAKTNTGTT